MTWKRLYIIVKKKRITLHLHKVTAHSEDLHNNAANLIAKTIAREALNIEIHSSEKCRFFFTLKHSDYIVEENSRRYLKHLIQNVRCGE
jgi:hypothetical protein